VLCLMRPSLTQETREQNQKRQPQVAVLLLWDGS